MRKQQYEKELTYNKTKWVCGILVVAIIAVMYLVLLNTVESKKRDQFWWGDEMICKKVVLKVYLFEKNYKSLILITWKIYDHLPLLLIS